MASTLLSPGVAVLEKDLTQGSIETVEINTGAIAGVFERGPIGVPTRISTEAELLEVFGKPNNNNYEYWWTAASFLGYGGVLEVVRALTGVTNANASSTAALLIENKDKYESQYAGGAQAWEWAAKSAGSQGNSIKVAVVDRGADQILTLASAPTTTAVGTQIANATATKTARIYSWDSNTKKLAIINETGGEFTTSDSVENGATDIAISGAAAWYDSQTIFTGLAWANIADRPGTSPYAAERGGSNDEMHVVVYDNDGKITGTPLTILEKFTYLSKASNAKLPEGGTNYYVDVLTEKSSWIYWGKHEETSYDISANGSTTTLTNTGGGAEVDFDILGNVSYSFGAGTDDYSVTQSEIEFAYDYFADAETLQVDFLIMGPGGSSVSETKAKATKLIDLAASKKTCIAFISPHKANVVGVASSTDQTNNVLSFYSTLASTSYAVFDSGYKYIYDRFNDVYRWVPCNGDTAGLCASVTAAGDPWFSPAGLNRGNLRNAIKLAYSPKKAERDRLYQKRINPITSIPGQGIVLFGDKTALATPSAFDRINVRRLFLVVEKTIENAAKRVLFELNDEFTRANFKNVVEPYLRDIQARRGITDFLVVCDESNNGPNVVDSNEFNADIYIKPARSINFITLTFVATRTGVSFEEVVPRR